LNTPIEASKTPNPQSKITGRELIDNIKTLYQFEGDEQAFIQQVTEKLTMLCCACIGFYFARAKDAKGDRRLQDWYLMGCFGLDSSHEDVQKQLSEQAVALYQRAKTQGFAHEPPNFPVLRIDQPILVVSLLDTANDSEAFIALVIDRISSGRNDRRQLPLNDVVVRLQLLADLPAQYHRQRNQLESVYESNKASVELTQHILELAALISDEQKFVAACILLVNEVAARFRCSRVYIGWYDDDYVKTIAVSHLERFERTTEIIQDIEAVFIESLDQNEEILYPDEKSEGSIVAAHKLYAYKSQLSQLLSMPLRDKSNTPIAVISCERLEGSFSEAELDVFRVTFNQLTAWLTYLHDKDQWLGKRLQVWAERQLNFILSSEKSLQKLLTALLSALILYLFFGTWEYRVEATATLATDDLAYLAAPFEGYIDTVNVHAGDQVTKNAILLQMDNAELHLKEAESFASVQQYLRESEKARANRDNANMLIAVARTEQAQTKLDQIQFYLQQSIIRAPFDGIIIEGDKEELLGAPVSKGDLLFKIAQLSGIYIKVNVKEEDINYIEAAQTADLTLLSKPDISLSIDIKKIIPLAEVVQNEGNSFQLKAEFTEDPYSWIRPGMNGMVKINTGQRSVIWILTHKTIDFLRLYFWW
jgi:multidrug efflux pump subunit AcrA (membrane-fusion protein)